MKSSKKPAPFVFFCFVFICMHPRSSVAKTLRLVIDLKSSLPS